MRPLECSACGRRREGEAFPVGWAHHDCGGLWIETLRLPFGGADQEGGDMGEIRIGQVVEYHGGLVLFHGVYVVTETPLEGDRGFRLQAADDQTGALCAGADLFHVLRSSITPMVEVAR